jgi:hypothetical protein
MSEMGTSVAFNDASMSEMGASVAFNDAPIHVMGASLDIIGTPVARKDARIEGNRAPTHVVTDGIRGMPVSHAWDL